MVEQFAVPTIDCPACGSRRPPRDDYILFCAACSHRWLSQSEDDHRAGEESTFTRDYAGYRPDPKHIEATATIVRTELAARMPPPANILDVGCGAGDLMMIAQSLGYAAEGIDISRASAEICRERQLNARAADFLNCEFRGEFDLVTMWDVVAHLRNPLDFFNRARSLLSDSGMLFVKTPAFGELSVRLSNRWPRLAGTILGAPSHVQYFNRHSVAVLLSRSGFEPEWISAGQARNPSTGGSLKRRAARRARRALGFLSGDSNLYLIAHPSH